MYLLQLLDGASPSCKVIAVLDDNEVHVVGREKLTQVLVLLVIPLLLVGFLILLLRWKNHFHGLAEFLSDELFASFRFASPTKDGPKLFILLQDGYADPRIVISA